MKRLVVIFGILALITLCTTLCNVVIKIEKLKNCNIEYEYTLYNDIKGVAKHCYAIDGINRCRIGKYAKKVKKIKNKEVCK